MYVRTTLYDKGMEQKALSFRSTLPTLAVREAGRVASSFFVPNSQGGGGGVKKCSSHAVAVSKRPKYVFFTIAIFIFFVIHYSHATYVDHGGEYISQSAVRARRLVASAPLPSAQACPGDDNTHQGNNKGKTEGKV